VAPRPSSSRIRWVDDHAAAAVSFAAADMNGQVHFKQPTAGAAEAQGLSARGAIPWHQDHAFWSTYSPALATLVIYLDEATAENGALQLIPVR